MTTAWGQKAIEDVGQELRKECLAVFGTTWSNDIAWRFARAAILAYNAALREPSEEIVKAGECETYEWQADARDWTLDLTKNGLRAMLTRADEENR